MAKKVGVAKPKKTEGEIIDAGASHAPEAAVESDGDSNDPYREVKIKLPVELKIKKVRYPPGVHIVPAHVADVMQDMVSKKMRADISIFVGKSHMVQRLLDRTLVVTEVKELNMQKLVNS